MATAPMRPAQGRPLPPATGGTLLARWGRRALDLVFPPRCAVCGAMGSFLCASCLASMSRAASPRCPVCWRPGRFGPACGRCVERPPAFAAVRTPFLMEGPAREAVHALKYAHFSALGEDMGHLMAGCFAEARLEAGMVVPVPLHGRRRRTRGYNQSALLTRAVAAALALPVDERALMRRRGGPRQAKAASAEERRRNVEGAFEARPQVSGQRVLLVDDVTTTGATFEACARALRAAGAVSVVCLAFARED